MKELKLNQLEEIVGGDTSDVISGACLAVGVLGLAKLVTLTGPVGWTVGAVCVVNEVGGHMDWW